MISKEAEKYNKAEKRRMIVDFSDLADTLKEIEEKIEKEQEDAETVEKFVARVEEELVPALEEVVSMMVPVYAYRREVTAARVIYESFLALARMEDDPKIQAIIAETIKKHHINITVDSYSKNKNNKKEVAKKESTT